MHVNALHGFIVTGDVRRIFYVRRSNSIRELIDRDPISVSL